MQTVLLIAEIIIKILN